MRFLMSNAIGCDETLYTWGHHALDDLAGNDMPFKSTNEGSPCIG
jgi:hypothetical protein